MPRDQNRHHATAKPRTAGSSPQRQVSTRLPLVARSGHALHVDNPLGGCRKRTTTGQVGSPATDLDLLFERAAALGLALDAYCGRDGAVAASGGEQRRVRSN